MTYSEKEYVSCLLQFVKTLPPQEPCGTRMVKISQLTLHPTARPNTWLFVAPTPVAVQTICMGIVNNHTLSNSGLIHIDPKCVLKTPYATIKAQSTNKLNIAKASIAYAPPKANEFKEMEQPILKNQHAYTPQDTRNEMHKHAKKNRNLGIGLSFTTLVVIGVIGWLGYNCLIKPRISILELPKYSI